MAISIKRTSQKVAEQVVEPPKEQLEPKVEVIPIKEKDYYFVVFRRDNVESWKIKSMGEELLRQRKYAEDIIPPNAVESYIISIKLPV